MIVDCLSVFDNGKPRKIWTEVMPFGGSRLGCPVCLIGGKGFGLINYQCGDDNKDEWSL